MDFVCVYVGMYVLHVELSWWMVGAEIDPPLFPYRLASTHIQYPIPVKRHTAQEQMPSSGLMYLEYILLSVVCPLDRTQPFQDPRIHLGT